MAGQNQMTIPVGSSMPNMLPEIKLKPHTEKSESIFALVG